MPTLQIFLDEEQNQKISDLSKEWKISKSETIRRIIDVFYKGELKNGS